MRRKTLWILAAMIAAVVVSLWIWQRVNAEPLTVEGARKELEQSLPVGSSGTAVDSYLDSRAIPHQHIDDSSNEFALIRGKSWFVRRDIQIRFHFDHSGRLQDYSLQEVFTGP
jgi:hypothetical protein